eukprot:2308010-Rhodomonas_salina.2
MEDRPQRPKASAAALQGNGITDTPEVRSTMNIGSRQYHLSATSQASNNVDARCNTRSWSFNTSKASFRRKYYSINFQRSRLNCSLRGAPREEREQESERLGREGEHRPEEANGIEREEQRDFGRRVEQAGALAAGERVSEQRDREVESVSLSSGIVSLESEERTNTARI